MVSELPVGKALGGDRREGAHGFLLGLEAPAIGFFHGPDTPKNGQVKGPAWAGWRNEDQEIRCGLMAIGEPVSDELEIILEPGT